MCLVLLTPALHAEPMDLLLSAEGKALLPVVISDKASDATKAVARELADYLGRIAGVKFDVTAGDGTRGIVLGTLAEFPEPSLKEALAVRNVYDGKEAYAIRSERQRLLLLGATDLGASHAAFRFLESLGCRWFFPAAEWEVVPTRKNLNVRIEETDRPRILARRIWYGYGPFTDKGHPRGSTCGKDYEAWARHNRMASSFRVHTGHAWQAIILANKKVFDEHPEYLALVNGKRRGEQLCVSNPGLRKLAIDWALAQAEKFPDREMISMECSDGAGHCECDECKKLGTHSNQVFFLANEAAKAIGKKYPGKMVGCLAYSQHSQPPDFPLEPNVYVQLTAGFIRGPYSWDQLVDLWPSKCSKMGFYEYFSVYLWDFDKLPGGRGANIPLIRERMQRYLKAGATSIDAESGNNWGLHGRGYYIANKLMWNPDADVNALLDDFYTQAFGKGADAMRRFYERWAPENEPLMSRGLIGELFRDVDEAARLTADRPDIQARLDPIKHYLRFNHLRWLLDHEKDKAKQKELSLEILTHGYRTRYEYMNHWTALMTSFAGDAAKKFDEPLWARGGKERKPYQNDTPISKEETARWFQEGLDYFVPTPVQEATFDYGDLVPVALPESKPALKPAGTVQQFQGAKQHAVASLKGEPIELEILPGVIAWYRDRPDAVCKLTDASGKVVASETLKLDGEKHRVVLKVPAKGTYFFTCQDSGSGWKLTTAIDQPVSLLVKRGQILHHLGQTQRLFFYVPKGTKQVQYFRRGAAHKVLGPDSKVLADVKVSDEVVTIPVPPGLDGQAWSFAPSGVNVVWLFNAPNVFAASPNALLLPRALAERDGITRKE
jgi:hypothetical protein